MIVVFSLGYAQVRKKSESNTFSNIYEFHVVYGIWVFIYFWVTILPDDKSAFSSCHQDRGLLLVVKCIFLKIMNISPRTRDALNYGNDYSIKIISFILSVFTSLRA